MNIIAHPSAKAVNMLKKITLLRKGEEGKDISIV
jgi:hypothetical protein